MKVLAFTKYGSLAASTRQRFIQYEPALAEAGIYVTYAPLLQDDHLRRLVANKRASPFPVARAYGQRFLQLITASHYDALWVHCELFPYLPGFIEILCKLWNKPIIFDYDDAIFHMYDASPRPLVRRLLGRKLVPLLRRASACCCGNPYLREYARRYCENTIVLPTVVDTTTYVPRQSARQFSTPVTIGWIGSPSTWKMVRPHLGLLAELCRTNGAEFRVIGAGDAAGADRFPGSYFSDWSKETEISDVQTMDIGIMPLNDSPFERGKSGYKLVQYMACGLPVVASPVGVNRGIVANGVNGFLASTEEEWRDALIRLIGDPELRARMGREGRALAESSYSLASQAPRLIEVFRRACALA